jgi:hypothetical protein
MKALPTLNNYSLFLYCMIHVHYSYTIFCLKHEFICMQDKDQNEMIFSSFQP